MKRKLCLLSLLSLALVACVKEERPAVKLKPAGVKFQSQGAAVTFDPLKSLEAYEAEGYQLKELESFEGLALEIERGDFWLGKREDIHQPLFVYTTETDEEEAFRDFHFKKEGKTLVIREKWKEDSEWEASLPPAYLFLPQTLQDLDLDMASGQVHVEGFDLEEGLRLDMASGSVRMDGIKTPQADLQMASGSLAFKGQARGAKLDMASGQALLEGDLGDTAIDMASGDLSVRTQKPMGNYAFKNEGYVAVLEGDPDKKEGEASYDFDLEVATGNVGLYFGGTQGGFRKIKKEFSNFPLTGPKISFIISGNFISALGR